MRLDLYDAHCHPTDTPSSLESIATMKVTKLLIMSTNFSDIDLVECTYTTHPDKIIPAFGYHPWFSHLLYTTSEPPASLWDHYSKVLTPCPTREFVETLPKPLSFHDYLNKMREYLQKHKDAIVGELGVDKSFRLPINYRDTPRQLTNYRVAMDHQLDIFKQQMQLAADFHRPVSVHAVHCHNALYDLIRALSIVPPSICLHSYSGSVDFLLQNWLKKPSRRKPAPVQSKMFISCSVLINITSDDRALKLLQNIPIDRVLSESDYHCAGDEMDKYVLQSLQAICKVYEIDLAKGSKQIEENFKKFINPESGEAISA